MRVGLFFLGVVMKVYISGAITGNKHYKRQFKKAERKLKKRGFDVFNPCIVPNIFTYAEFMKIDLMALECCDLIYMLKGWTSSRGAKMELQRARELNKIIEFEELTK